MNYRFLIESDLSLNPEGEFDYLTQNSVGTQRIVIVPNGWAPAEGETLAIVFGTEGKNSENAVYETKPIQLGKTRGKNEYFTVIPDEVVLLAGDWEMNVCLLRDFDAETDSAASRTYGEKYAFSVISTLRGEVGAPSRYDLANMAQFQRDLESGIYAARGFYPWREGFVYGEGEIAFFSQIAGCQFGAFVRSLVSGNAAPPYDEDGELNENWEEELNLNHVSEDFFSELKALESVAAGKAQEAKDAADEAKQSAENAKNAAGNIAELKDRAVHYVQALPDATSAVEGEAYAVIQDADGNIFDLYLLQDGEWTYLGGERFLANGWTRYRTVLSREGWMDMKQSVSIPSPANGLTVDAVFPEDGSALAYLRNGIRFEKETGGTLTFSCTSLPLGDIAVLVDIKAEYTVPTLANYYTAHETDSLLEQRDAEIARVLMAIEDEAHFRGYFGDAEAIRACPANANDFAWDASSGKVWVYGENGWEKTDNDIPDKVSPPAILPPLPDGDTAQTGVSERYAREDHVHSHDETRASAQDLEELEGKVDEIQPMPLSDIENLFA